MTERIRTAAAILGISDAKWLRLAVAGEPYGLSAAALRAEAKQGRLAIYRLRGKDWTTAKDVQEMFEKCRVQAKALTYGSEDLGKTETHSGQPSGSSKTEDANLALAAAQAIIRRRKESSQSTSSESTSRRAASATSNQFPSPT